MNRCEKCIYILLKTTLSTLSSNKENGELKIRIYTQLIVVFHTAPSKVSPPTRVPLGFLARVGKNLIFQKPKPGQFFGYSRGFSH